MACVCEGLLDGVVRAHSAGRTLETMQFRAGLVELFLGIHGETQRASGWALREGWDLGREGKGRVSEGLWCWLGAWLGWGQVWPAGEGELFPLGHLACCSEQLRRRRLAVRASVGL